jgi:hypothetical protein
MHVLVLRRIFPLYHQFYLLLGFRFRNKLVFYGEELLAPRPTPKLEGHPMSAVCDCVFNIFALYQKLKGIGYFDYLAKY